MIKSSIPYIDLRGKKHNDLLRAFPDKARALLSASRRTYGIASRIASFAAFPVGDFHSHNLLKNAKTPYLHEIEEAAGIVGKAGIYTLNIADSWACTSGAYVSSGRVHLLRVLDWPFPDLGKHLVISLNEASAGIYYNITWPAISGVFQALAPNRFAAAINLAPMRKHGFGLAGDWLVNRFVKSGEGAIFPSHLLRQVFEHAKNYNEARIMLSEMPISSPIIFTLSGINQGEGCVIERLENSAYIHDIAAEPSVSASNQFISAKMLASTKKGWRPREIDSEGRYLKSCEIDLRENTAGVFDWLQHPILNNYTRLAMQAEASTGLLYVQGYEGLAAVTNLFTLPKLQN